MTLSTFDSGGLKRVTGIESIFWLDEMENEMKFRVLPMNVFGVKLYAVENQGDIERYCDTKDDAEKRCDELNEI